MINPVGDSQGGMFPHKAVLGKEDFLKLLIEQLKNQDPLNPMDSLDFTAQLAQFSSLEQLFNISDGINRLISSSDLKDRASLIYLVGKEVEVSMSRIHLVNGEAKITFNAPEDISRAEIKIRDASGNIVKVIDVRPVEKGMNVVTWNGVGDSGIKLDDGTYTVEITGYKSDGSEITLSSVKKGIVKSVSLGDGRITLDDGEEVSFQDIIKVGFPEISEGGATEGGKGSDFLSFLSKIAPFISFLK